MAIDFVEEPNNTIDFQEDEKQNDPSLSFVERGKFSFGDTAGRESFLQEKFPGKDIQQMDSGKFSVDGVPIDPEGFDLGDIADVSDEVIRLGMQIKGAAEGGAFGLTKGAPIKGMMAGGGVGRAAGQGVVEFIGREFGVRKGEMGDIFKDILKQGAEGVAGEAGGQILSKLSKPGVKFVKGVFDKLNKKVSDPIAQNLLNFTAGVEKGSIQRVQQRGGKTILTEANMDEQAVLNIATKINEGTKKAMDIRGQAVQKAKNELSKNTNKRVFISPLRKQFNKELKEASILDDKFQPIDPLIKSSDTEKGRLLNLKVSLEKFRDKMSTKDALRLRTEIDDIVKFGQEGKLTVGTNEERILKQLRAGVTKQLHMLSDDLTKADANFSEVRGLQETLKNKLALDQGEGERFLRRVLSEKFPEMPKIKLQELDSILPKKNKFFEELQDVIAARDLSSGTLRAIRSGMLGTAFGVAGQINPIVSGVLGVGLSTPKLVGKGLTAQQELGKGVARSISGLGKVASREAAPAFLNKIGLREK